MGGWAWWQGGGRGHLVNGYLVDPAAVTVVIGLELTLVVIGVVGRLDIGGNVIQNPCILCNMQ